MQFAIMILLTISTALTCDLTATIYSKSKHPVWAQFTFPNQTKSPAYAFENSNQNYTVKISGQNCNLKPTILKSYSENPKSDLTPIGETSAFIDGMGSLDYLVYETDAPRMGMRIGVACGFGDCGGRG